MNMEKKIVYLDYNATTPLEPEVISSIHEALQEAWGNPSSLHSSGVKAKDVIAKSRLQVASMLGASEEDIVFTSGGTEANNMILNTALHHYHETFPDSVITSHLPHIITSNIEHDSVKLVLEEFVRQGKADVTFVEVSKLSGRAEASDVAAAVGPNTCLITIMMANNETGVIQPVEEIVKLVRRKQDGCKKRGGRILFHTDAAQTIGKIAVNVERLSVDFLTVVGHKFYGPRIGAIYAKNPGKDTPLRPMLYGGGQERNFRPGTENTAMIAGLGEAAELVTANLQNFNTHMNDVRDYLESRLMEEFGEEGVHFNGKYASSDRLPNTCNFSILSTGQTGNALLTKTQHIQASIGAACHSAANFRCSSVLLASGATPEVAKSAIRCSVGRSTSRRDIDLVIKDLRNAVNSLKDK